MKKLIFIAVVLFATVATAQNYIAPKPNERQLTEAKELAREIDKRISLTEIQLLDVEQLNGEFIARRDEIVGNRELSIERKNELLAAMYKEQSREMADIVTRRQLRRYRRVRGDIQPLIILEK